MTHANLDRSPHLTGLTRLADRVLWALSRGTRPLGAYQLAQMLTSMTGTAHHPNSIYRVLQAMLDRGLVLQVASAKGWVVRSLKEDGAAMIMVCDDCGCAEQIPAGEIEGKLGTVVSTRDFRPSRYHVEVLGRCRTCVDRAPGN